VTQQPIETILMRQLASYLSVPVLVVDPEGTVVFFNEPAERILGVRFDETGRVSPARAAELIQITDADGRPLTDENRPLLVALNERRPAYVRSWVLRQADGVRLEVETTAFPLVGQAGTMLGAVAMFWETHPR
jgi:PAS domain-containing protein